MDLRSALTAAIKARDAIAVSALRSALAALDNATAVDAGQVERLAVDHPRVAGSVIGVGAGDVERKHLTATQISELITAEVEQRLAAARDYERLGKSDRADRLRAEARVLTTCLAAQLEAVRAGRIDPLLPDTDDDGIPDKIDEKDTSSARH